MTNSFSAWYVAEFQKAYLAALNTAIQSYQQRPTALSGAVRQSAAPNPITEWNAALDAKTTNGMARSTAIMALMRENKALTQRYNTARHQTILLAAKG